MNERQITAESQQNHTQCRTALVVEYLCEQIKQSKTTQSYSFSLKKKKKILAKISVQNAKRQMNQKSVM